MTFTQFLSRTTSSKPSFLTIAKHDRLWPSESNRLEDFEEFLLCRTEEESVHVIPELRDLWRDFAQAEKNGKHDLDLALAAWGDYARHLRTCSGSRLAPCEAADQLLERALSESRFDDLHHPLREAVPCGDIDDLDVDGEEGDSLVELALQQEEDEDERHTELF